ncbi:hypothetical protein IV203_025709 [Nitzschia inconspicua]|uniref:Uncharacterized protein n=1 Tax=Nitzschia inconspicua TaxID=303405 RepID=A0A9K3LI02_9STRA|nr:hypothetical protein IV203_025709 [Nitzschia inconspicua]
MTAPTTMTYDLQLDSIPSTSQTGGAAYYDDDDDEVVVPAIITHQTNTTENANENTTKNANATASIPSADPSNQSCFHKYCCCQKCWSCCLPFQSSRTAVTTFTTLGLYWAILYLLATSYNPGDRRFTLTVGDTWRVQLPLNLWSRSSISIQSSSESQAGLEVYEFLPVLDYSRPPLCPPLTVGDDPSLTANANSPIVTMHESDNTIHLEMEQYQYRYFHLNRGSVLKISVRLVQPPTTTTPHSNNSKNHKAATTPIQSQTLGATNIYILQGYHTLKELETQPNTIDITRAENFRGRSIEKRYLAFAGSLEMDYTVPSSDYYIVVFDNAAPGRSTNLQVSITVQMATHYLSDMARPICPAKDTITPGGCAWIFTNDQDRQRVASTCIIAKAVSPLLTQQVQSQTNDTTTTKTTTSNNDNKLPKFDMAIDDSQTVIVQVHAPLGSTRLILAALAPIAILCIVWFWENGQRCIQHLRRNGGGWFSRRQQRQRQQQPRMGKGLATTTTNETTPLNKKRYLR